MKNISQQLTNQKNKLNEEKIEKYNKKKNESTANIINGLIIFVIIILVITYFVMLAMKNAEIKNKPPCKPPRLIPKPLTYGETPIYCVLNKLNLYKIQSFSNSINRTMYTYGANNPGALVAKNGSVVGGYYNCKPYPNSKSCLTYTIISKNGICTKDAKKIYHMPYNTCIDADACHSSVVGRPQYYQNYSTNPWGGNMHR